MLAPQNYKKAEDLHVVGRCDSKQEGWLRFPIRSHSDSEFPDPMLQNWAHSWEKDLGCEQWGSQPHHTLSPDLDKKEEAGRGNVSFFDTNTWCNNEVLRSLLGKNRHLPWKAMAHNSNEHIIKQLFLFSFELHYRNCSFLIFYTFS